jgi:CubicO group peptidase (beta-lactamase class C family)
MRSHIDRKSLAVILVVFIILIGVNTWMERNNPPEPRVMSSYWPTAGWKYATPSQMGMDSGPLQDMVDAIEASSFRVDSAMVIKDGYIVLDEYFGGFEKGELHIIYSCTKSVVSTIFGIAYGNGLIPDLDTRLLDIYPDIIPENPGEWKDSITLRDLLMMSGGFDARDSWIYEWERARNSLRVHQWC